MTSYRTGSGRGLASRIILTIGAVIAIILIAQILFWLFSANPANALVTFVGQIANVLALWFVGLFATGNATLQVILDYGLAAVFWVIVAGLVARLLSR